MPKTRLKARFTKAVSDALYASPYQLSAALNAIATAGAERICTYNIDDLIEEALGTHRLPFRSLTPGEPIDATFTATTVYHPHRFHP